MPLSCKCMTAARLFALVIGPCLLAVAGPSRAQTIACQPERSAYVLGTSAVSSGAAAAPVLKGEPPASESEVGSPSPAPASTAPDEVGWHLVASPYLWFPGVHGTVGVGAATPAYMRARGICSRIFASD
jgi:hypothetical protein